MIVVGVPVVARQFLIIPVELAGLDVERDGGIAEEIGGRGDGTSSAAPWRSQPRIGIGIGDAPVEHLPLRIVGAGLPPGTGGALFQRHVGPRYRRRVRPARRWCRISRASLPVLRVMGGDEAVVALACSQVRLEITLPSATRMPPAVLAAIVELGLPALLCRSGRRSRPGSRRARRNRSCPARWRGFSRAPPWPLTALRIVALVFPEQIAVGGVHRLDGGARRDTDTSRRRGRWGWIPAVPSGRPRAQAMRSWPTLLLLIWVSGLKRCSS